MTLRWLIAMTKGGAEWEAHMDLRLRSVETVLPIHVRNVRRSRYRKGFLEPLFPGYIWTGLEANQSAEMVKNSPFVRDMLRDGSNYVTVSEAAMASLKAQGDEAYQASLAGKVRRIEHKVGQWVQVPHGILAGTPVQITRVDKHEIEGYVGNLKVTWTPELTLGNPVASCAALAQNA